MSQLLHEWDARLLVLVSRPAHSCQARRPLSAPLAVSRWPHPASCSRSAPASSTTSRRRLPPLVPRLHQVPPPAALTAWPPRFVRFSSDCRGVPAL